MNTEKRFAQPSDRKQGDRSNFNIREVALRYADRYVPHASPGKPLSFQESLRLRTGIVIAWLGVVCASSTAGLYAYLGSPISGVALSVLAIALLFVPTGIRRGFSLTVLGNVFTAATWLITFVVASRTGGFQSPALVWAFIHPITTYVACGKRSAQVWAALSVTQVSAFYVFDQLGMQSADDLRASTLTVLRLAGFIGCILTNTSLIAVIETVRRASQAAQDEANRTLERERILGDMHDGIGSQLLGLILQVRAKRIDDERLVHSLCSCLEDVRLIVDSLDPIERPFAVSLGEFRSRLEAKCAAAAIEVLWNVQLHDIHITQEQTLHIQRALQEMTSNAIRHAHTERIDVHLGPVAGAFEVSVRDYGIGVPAVPSGTAGRGMTSLQTRALRLGGSFAVTPVAPGTLAKLRFPY